jgi:hypothetical protein
VSGVPRNKNAQWRKNLIGGPKFVLRTEIRVATFDANHSVTDSTQSTAASIQKLPDSVVKPVSRAHFSRIRYVRRNDQVIDECDVSC